MHPFGAGTDYIWSYLLRVDPSITYKEVEELMGKYPTCFTMEVEGVGLLCQEHGNLLLLNLKCPMYSLQDCPGAF